MRININDDFKPVEGTVQNILFRATDNYCFARGQKPRNITIHSMCLELFAIYMRNTHNLLLLLNAVVFSKNIPYVNNIIILQIEYSVYIYIYISILDWRSVRKKNVIFFLFILKEEKTILYPSFSEGRPTIISHPNGTYLKRTHFRRVYFL